mgnify:CR=1 FL=1
MMTEQKNNIDNQEPVVVHSPTDSQLDQEDSYSAEDIERGKTMAGLSYLIFFLPLVACPESRYARFHANQSLLLVITAITGNVILSIIPIINLMLLPLFSLSILVLGIMGLVNGFGGKAKQLPIIGKFTILK